MTATAPADTTWTIVLPHFYSERKPLTFEYTGNGTGNLRLTLTGNSRHHWRQRSSVNKRIRETTARLLTLKNIPPQDFVTAIVELHHPEKGVKYVRDRDNLWAMGKPMWDALQPAKEPHYRKDKVTGELKKVHGTIPGAGIVPDDSDKYVYKDVRIVRGSNLRPFPVIAMHIGGLGSGPVPDM
jgi:hypothetical protein